MSLVHAIRNHPKTCLSLLATVVAITEAIPTTALARTHPSNPTTAPLSAHVLGGFTSQGWPIVIKLSTDGRTVTDVRTGLDMSCTSGDKLPLKDLWTRLQLGPNGRVQVGSTVPPMTGGAVSITGGTDSFSGRLNRNTGTFAGSWRLQLKLATSSGQTTQCDSGPVTFTAIV